MYKRSWMNFSCLVTCWTASIFTVLIHQEREPILWVISFPTSLPWDETLCVHNCHALYFGTRRSSNAEEWILLGTRQLWLCVKMLTIMDTPSYPTSRWTIIASLRMWDGTRKPDKRPTLELRRSRVQKASHLGNERQPRFLNSKCIYIEVYWRWWSGIFPFLTGPGHPDYIHRIYIYMGGGCGIGFSFCYRR